MPLFKPKSVIVPPPSNATLREGEILTRLARGSHFLKSRPSGDNTGVVGDDTRRSSSATPITNPVLLALSSIHPAADSMAFFTAPGAADVTDVTAASRILLASPNVASMRATMNTAYAINVQALTSSPVDGQTIYFGMLPKAPVTTGGNSKIYVRRAGIIRVAEIYCYSGTAGTAENWSAYIRVNNSSNTLIRTLGVATNERIFSNDLLAISLSAGDYFEIMFVNPTWTINPLTTIFGGYVLVE